MTWRIPLCDLMYDAEEENAVLEVLRSKWLTMGRRTEEFEAAFANYLGCDSAVAVSSGTAALHVAVRVLRLGAGDEVIVPALTFVATANAVLYEGATPVLADITGPHDLTVDPRDIERKITENTRAIIVMHYGGHACAMDEIVAIAEDRGLALIEDAAHAPGATYGERAAGTLGHAGCFSFFSNKNIATGEGGMITMADPDHSERARILRSHAMTSATISRYRGNAYGYDITELGFNYRITEIEAALGLVQLGRLEQGNELRARRSGRYREGLATITGLDVPFGQEWADARPEGTRSAHHIETVLLPEGTDREQVASALAAQGIQTSVHYRPLHAFSHPLLAASPAYGLTQVDAIAGRLMTLPLWPGITEPEVDSVVDALGSALAV